MNNIDILNKAKYIIFPNKAKTYPKYLTQKGLLLNYLPIVENSLYSNLKNNTHHYTTSYHINYVMPLLANIFHFKYNISDFNIIPNVVDNNDLSYLYPKTNYNYTVYGYEKNIVINCDYSGLVYNKKFKSDLYHGLYVFQHSCSRIVNHNLHNGRKLFISSDSQIIPSIAPLTCYFEEVWCFDNRTGKYFDKQSGHYKMNIENTKSFSKYYEDVEFTDVLIELYTNPLDWYTKVNLY